MFKFSGISKTYWESSYFGGVKRVLTEYPFYRLNYDLYAYLSKTSKAGSELSIYQSDKLVNILMSQAFQSGERRMGFLNWYKAELMKTLSSPKLLSQRTVMTSSRPKISIEIRKDILQSYIQFAKEGELKAIFDEYGDSILDEGSRIVILSDMPNNDGASSSKAESEEDESEEGDDQNESKSGYSRSLINSYAEAYATSFVNSFKDKKNVEDYTVTVKNLPKVGDITFTKDEMVFAKKLAQMLDISHDTKPDVVNNLLHGKMDTNKLAEVLSGNNRVYTKTLEHQMLKPFKVIVLGDYSGSMSHAYGGDPPIKFQKKVMKSLFYMFHEVLDIKDVEFYGHSGSDEPILYRFHSPEYPHFEQTFGSFVSLDENYDGPVIEHLHKITRDKTSNPVLLITLSDGQPSGHNYGGKKANDNLKRILEKVKRDNFVTVGIGMQYQHQNDLYQYSVTINDLSSISSVAQIINRAVKENLVVEE